jgi:UrcA family protein
MIDSSSMRRSHILVATAVAGFVTGMSSAVGADVPGAEVPQVVVEAKAPVHTAQTKEGAPSGAHVDLLSVRYNVHLEGLDLTKYADVQLAESRIKVAAQKGCVAIKAAYPVEHLSDEGSCVTDATKAAMAQLHAMIATAQGK